MNSPSPDACINPSAPLAGRPRHYSLRLLAVTLITALLVGCAGERMHNEGLDLIDAGKPEEGLAKLEQAVKEDPEDLQFRSDLLLQREQAVRGLLADADKQRAAGNQAEAAALYQRVLKIDRANPRAAAGLAKLDLDQRNAAAVARAKELMDRHDLEGARSAVHAILRADPDQRDAKAMQRKIDEQLAEQSSSGPTLQPEFRKPVTLQFRDANLRMVIEALSRTNGINIILDKDVRADLKTTIFVKDASLEETLDLILLQNQLEKKVVSDNTIFIYPNTPAKIKDYQELKIRTFQLVNADAKAMQTMVKTLLKVKDSFVDEKTNSLVLRDTPDTIRLAEKMIAAQDQPEPEVMLEVEVLEISRARLTELGVKLPEQLSMTAAGVPSTTTQTIGLGGAVTTTTTPAAPLTLDQLGKINGSYFNLSPITASIDLRREVGDGNILASPRIRVRNHEKAKIHIGDRVPVITNAVTPVSTGTPVVTGTVQYLDVGLKLDVEPDIHLDDDVAIKLGLEVSNIVREVNSGPTLAYQIGTRSANTVLRLKDGETQVLAGLISDEDRHSAQKFPGLGDLPILGRLFSSHKNDTKKTEIVLSITPHLTRAAQRPDVRDVEYWSGTESTLRSGPLVQQTAKTTTVAYRPSAAAGATQAPATPAAASPATPATPVIAAAAAEPAPPAGPPITLNWQGPSQAQVGQELQVTVGADASQSLGTLSFTLGYDPAALTLVRVAEGELLKQNGKKTLFTNKVDQDAGQVFAQVARVGKDGVTGKGSVATFTFKVRAAKTQAPLILKGSTPLGTGGRVLPYTPPAPFVVTLSEGKK